MAQVVSPGSTNTLENKSKSDPHYLHDLLGVPPDKSQKISDPDTQVTYDGGWTNPNWHIGGVPASSMPASTTGVLTAQDDTFSQARAEKQHTVGLAGAVRAGDRRANDVSDHEEETMNEGDRAEVEEEKREENRAKPQTVGGDEPEENQENSGLLHFLPTDAAVMAAIATAARRRRPRFMRKAARGLKKAEEKAEKAAARVKQAEKNATQAEKDATRLKSEEAAAQHAAETARVAERTAKANARTDEVLRNAEKTALTTRRAEQAARAAREAAERSRTAQQAVLEATKKSEMAKDAIEKAETLKRAAVIAEKSLSGFRRFFTVASSVGTSTLVGIAAGRLVHAAGILAFAPKGQDPKIAMEKAIGVLTASPFSDAATKKLKEHDWGGFATQLASDVVDGAKDMAQGAKELYDNREKIEVAMGKAIEDIKKIGEVYARNPGDVKSAIGLVFADLGLTPKNAQDIAYGELTGDQSPAKRLALDAGSRGLNDNRLIETIAGISNTAQGIQPQRPSTTLHAENGNTSRPTG